MAFLPLYFLVIWWLLTTFKWSGSMMWPCRGAFASRATLSRTLGPEPASNKYPMGQHWHASVEQSTSSFKITSLHPVLNMKLAFNLLLTTCPVLPGGKTSPTGSKQALTPLFFLQIISAKSSAAVWQFCLTKFWVNGFFSAWTLGHHDTHSITTACAPRSLSRTVS